MSEQRRKVGLPGGRREQVVAAHDLVDVLRGVVDDDREVVGGHAVVATEHDVVDGSGELAVQDVRDRPGVDVGAESQRRRPLRRPSGPLGVGEVAAGAGIRAGRRVRRRGGVEDLAPRAEARVHAAGVGEPVDGVVVEGAAIALSHDVAVPVDPERAQVVELLFLGTGPDAVEVLDAHQERATRRPREQPGQQRGAEIADVQVTRRRRRESSGAHRASEVASRSGGTPRPPRSRDARTPLGRGCSCAGWRARSPRTRPPARVPPWS